MAPVSTSGLLLLFTKWPVFVNRPVLVKRPVFAKVARAGLGLRGLAIIGARAASVSIELRGLGVVGRLLREVFLPLIMTLALLVM